MSGRYCHALSTVWSYIWGLISGATAKNPPIDADSIVIVDSAASDAVKRVTWANAWAWVVAKIQGLTAKTTPVDADILTIQDSADTNALKELTVGDLWDNRYVEDAKAIKLDDFAAPDDNTDLDATSSAHGLLPKLSGNTTDYLRGDGTYAVPAPLGQLIETATGITLTAAQCHFALVRVSGAVEIDLPAVSGVDAGAVVQIQADGAVAVSIDPDASDRIVLDGTALDDGDAVQADGFAGTSITLFRDDDGWVEIGRNGDWSDIG